MPPTTLQFCHIITVSLHYIMGPSTSYSIIQVKLVREEHSQSLVLWGFDEAGSSLYSLWVGARLADDLLTSISGFVVLTSLELWAEPLPRSAEGEFPIADRRSGWAKDYTWRQNWDVLVEPEKLGGRTGVRLSSSVELLLEVLGELPVEPGWFDYFR